MWNLLYLERTNDVVACTDSRETELLVKVTILKPVHDVDTSFWMSVWMYRTSDRTVASMQLYFLIYFKKRKFFFKSIVMWSHLNSTEILRVHFWVFFFFCDQRQLYVIRMKYECVSTQSQHSVIFECVVRARFRLYTCGLYIVYSICKYFSTYVTSF